MNVFKPKIIFVDYWTEERVANGMRRYAREFFDGAEANLPQTFYAYRNIVPVERRRESRRQRLFPPFDAILRFHESPLAAWQSLGFAVEKRTAPNKTAEIRGEQFGFLVAAEYSHSASGSGRIWKCICRCGNECFVSVKNLRRLRQVSCGCYRRNEAAKLMGAKISLDLTGKTFGKLVAKRIVGKYGRNKKQNLWECVCACGKIAHVPVSSLTTGATRSCGCARRETGETRKARISAGGAKRLVSYPVAARIRGVSVAAETIENLRTENRLADLPEEQLKALAEAVERAAIARVLGILNY